VGPPGPTFDHDEKREEFRNVRSRRQSKSRPVSERSLVVAGKDQIFCDLGEEVVILDLASGIYYGLNGVAARIWNLLQEPRTVGEIRDALLEDFDVERERCELDLMALLQQLESHELIQVDDGP
jgi:hypothetical protein